MIQHPSGKAKRQQNTEMSQPPGKITNRSLVIDRIVFVLEYFHKIHTPKKGFTEFHTFSTSQKLSESI
jgi:hypothetical protein